MLADSRRSSLTHQRSILSSIFPSSTARWSTLSINAFDGDRLDRHLRATCTPPSTQKQPGRRFGHARNSCMYSAVRQHVSYVTKHHTSDNAMQGKHTPAVPASLQPHAWSISQPKHPPFPNLHHTTSTSPSVTLPLFCPAAPSPC